MVASGNSLRLDLLDLFLQLWTRVDRFVLRLIAFTSWGHLQLALSAVVVLQASRAEGMVLRLPLRVIAIKTAGSLDRAINPGITISSQSPGNSYLHMSR
ncbi:hypothetical protein LB505_011966 [Fusarium chuoi]|nr:hypothetical protein LB505_011966 [Fusarium chuoi]